MRSLLQIVAILILFAGIPITAVTFFDKDILPDVQPFRWFLPIPLIGALVYLFWDQLGRRDLAPDYLKQQCKNYFLHDGVAFMPCHSMNDGSLQIDIYYQNQYDGPCEAAVALRPKGGWFRSSSMRTIRFDFDCEPGEYGVASKCIPVPADMLGKKVTFEVGSTARHSEGRGKLLRFHEGITLRTDASFVNASGTALQAAGLFSGFLVRNKHASFSFVIPTDCAEDVEDELATA